MTDDLYFKWMATVLIFASGFVLGRAVFSPKVAKRDRILSAGVPVAIFFMQIGNVIEMPHYVHWALLGISGIAILSAVVIPAFRKPTEAT